MECFEFDTNPISTLSAPNGVTSIGGANVYAAKLATGITVNGPDPVCFGYHTFANNHCIQLSVEWFGDTRRGVTCSLLFLPTKSDF